jgi:hypothetical protein
MDTNAPNQAMPGNRMNGSFPLSARGGSGNPVNPPNHGPGGDMRGGSFPLGESGSPINPPNDTTRFTVADALAEHNKTYNAPAAVAPGKGAVPVSPGVGGVGGLMPAAFMRGR